MKKFQRGDQVQSLAVIKGECSGSDEPGTVVGYLNHPRLGEIVEVSWPEHLPGEPPDWYDDEDLVKIERSMS